MTNDFKQQLKTAYDKDASRRDAREIGPWKAKIREEFLARLKSENKKKFTGIRFWYGKRCIIF